MCWLVKCGTCGKTTWDGCGRHVESVMKDVQEKDKCKCVREVKEQSGGSNWIRGSDSSSGSGEKKKTT